MNQVSENTKKLLKEKMQYYHKLLSNRNNNYFNSYKAAYKEVKKATMNDKI